MHSTYEVRDTIFGMNTAEINDYIKKLFRIKLCTRKSVGVRVYLPQEWSYEARKIAIFETW